MVLGTTDGVLIGLLLIGFVVLLPLGLLIFAVWTLTKAPWPRLTRIAVALVSLAIGAIPVVLFVLALISLSHLQIE